MLVETRGRKKATKEEIAVKKKAERKKVKEEEIAATKKVKKEGIVVKKKVKKEEIVANNVVKQDFRLLIDHSRPVEKACRYCGSTVIPVTYRNKVKGLFIS